MTEGWFTRDVYDVLGIQNCETTVWAREAFALGKCLSFNSTVRHHSIITSYKLSCTPDALRAEYFSDRGCTNQTSYKVKYFQFECMNACSSSTDPPIPSGKWAVHSLYNDTHGCSGDAAAFVAVKNDYCVYVYSAHQTHAHSFILKYPKVYHYNNIDCTVESNITLSTTLNEQCAAIDTDPIGRPNYDYSGNGVYDDYIYIDQKNLTNMLPHGQWSLHRRVVTSLIGMRIGIAIAVIAVIVCCVGGCIRWYRSRDKVRVYSDPTAEAQAKEAAEKAAAEKRRMRGVRKNRGVSSGSSRILKEEQGAKVDKKYCPLCCC